MPISAVVKNFRDGTILLEDGTTPTPLSLTVAFEAGDFSIDNITQGASYDVNAYLDRGEFGSLRKTNKVFPTFTLTLHQCQYQFLSWILHQPFISTSYLVFMVNY